MKQICVEINEEIYDNAIKVLDDVGLTASLAVNLFLSKVVKEQSISWMFEKKHEHGGNDVVNQPTGFEQVRLTKNNAKKLISETMFCQKYQKISIATRVFCIRKG